MQLQRVHAYDREQKETRTHGYDPRHHKRRKHRPDFDLSHEDEESTDADASQAGEFQTVRWLHVPSSPRTRDQPHGGEHYAESHDLSQGRPTM